MYNQILPRITVNDHICTILIAVCNSYNFGTLVTIFIHIRSWRRNQEKYEGERREINERSNQR